MHFVTNLIQFFCMQFYLPLHFTLNPNSLNLTSLNPTSLNPTSPSQQLQSNLCTKNGMSNAVVAKYVT